MMRLLEIPEYIEDVRRVASLDLPWGKIRKKTLLITGGTGSFGNVVLNRFLKTDIG